MRKIMLALLLVLLVIVTSLTVYGAKGWFDATQSAQALKHRANALIQNNLGGDNIGEERLQVLLMVQDPGFYAHSGLDLQTPGAGVTTITQSLSKRLAFTKFMPGIRKIRQTGYAFGLEQVLSKQQILALFLETLEMGPSEDGWVTGFFNASEIFFSGPPKDITDEQFLTLVAALIAPGKFKISEPNDQLTDRIARIKRLVAQECAPLGLNDVWLKGCK